MPAKRINITQPPDWIAAWEAAAASKGLTLAEWIGRRCNAGLDADTRARLSKRGRRGVYDRNRKADQ